MRINPLNLSLTIPTDLFIMLKSQTLQTMVLNTGLKMKLNPSQSDKIYDGLVAEVMTLCQCSKPKAIAVIIANN